MSWGQFKVSISHVSSWHCGSIVVAGTIGGRFESLCCNGKYFFTEFSENMMLQSRRYLTLPHPFLLHNPLIVDMTAYVLEKKITQHTR